MRSGWTQNIRRATKYRVIVRCLDCSLVSEVKVLEGERISCPFCDSINLEVLSYSAIRKENEERTNQTRWTYECPSCGARIFSISPVSECPACHSRELIVV